MIARGWLVADESAVWLPSAKFLDAGVCVYETWRVLVR